MRLIGRFFVVAFAVFVASAATGIAIAWGVFGPDWHVMSGDAGERFAFWGVAFFGSLFAAAVGVLPLLVMIVLAEAFKIRSLLAHAVAGAILLLAGYYGSGLARPSYEESIDYAPPPISHELQLVAAAGAVFGFSYWLIAGRNAGRWCEKRA